MTVQSGTATVHSSGNHVTITASQNAFLNWQSFNIDPGETTRFNQPSAASIVWNRVNDSNPSRIFGNLEANGVVVLMNQSGFFFGPNSSVSAAGLIVSTAPVAPDESSAGLFWKFEGAPPQASIINYGHLDIASGGSLFLIGQRIENHGMLSAPGGEVRLMAGNEVLVNERPDGRGLSATVRLPAGSVDNSGRILADAGTIAMSAQVVNQNGLAQANSVRERNGVIELIATDSVTLGDHSTLSAKGGENGASNGGTVTVKSSASFEDSVGSKITVAGGRDGGNGGHVELSAARMPRIQSAVDGSARSGYRGGALLIDPQDIVIGNTGTESAPNGTIGVLDPPVSGTLNLNVNSSFLGFSKLSFQATRNITVTSGTIWDLVASTGLSEPNSLLKLEAGNDITLG
ncbi:MAG TPA: filamentous hemagglutinin N-terminal domain-containing protein, partial [Verrucomicrobiae bacterium]|nr:filamentous hemagglutinin N-terminal domain-containing protein [Verrucomicrobiae bacterium]